MSSISRDLGYAVRILAKRPGFAAVAILTLALGIGANTAIFSVVQGVLLRSVPFPDARNLVFMGEHSEQVPNMSVSYPNFLDWRERNRSFEAIAAHNFAGFNVTGLETPEALLASRVSATLFGILGVEPLIGRAFTEEEDRVGGERVTLVSYDFWQTRLGADPDVVAQVLSLDGDPYEIIGVMPAGFLYPISNNLPDLWMPIGQFSEDWLEQRGNHPGIYVTGRLKDGVDLERGRNDMERVARELEDEYPDSNTGNSVSYSALSDRVVRNIRPSLLVLGGAVTLVLLIACVNVANLLLAKGLARRREIAIRAAMGSSKWQLVRQLLTESVLLAVVAGALGVLLAYGALALLRASIDPNLMAAFGTIGIDTTVLGFTTLLSVGTGIFFGLAPAVQLVRTDVTSGLNDGGRGGSARQGRFQSALVALQVALAMVLLVGAFLFIQGFYRLTEADPGFSDENVLTLNVSLSETEYPEPGEQIHFFDELLRGVRSLPGVSSAATTMPLLGGWQQTILAEGEPARAPGDEISVDITRVSPDYFETMGIHLVRGRTFQETDREDSVKVAVVDTTLANSFWPDQDPISKRVKMASDPADESPWLQVVGVVEHTKNYGIAQPSRIEIYMPVKQNPVGFGTLVVKTSSAPRALLPAVRHEVLELDPNQPVSRVRTLTEITAATTSPERMAAGFLGVFSGVALTLAAIGIYGVMAYTVAQRRNEIGIRMALGASTGNVLTGVITDGLKLALIGIASGLAIAFVAAPLLSSVLFGIDARDPATFLMLPVVLAAVAIAASAVPALRATRVSPVTVLRYE